jgi:hypothetical protein
MYDREPDGPNFASVLSEGGRGGNCQGQDCVCSVAAGL